MNSLIGSKTTIGYVGSIEAIVVGSNPTLTTNNINTTNTMDKRKIAAIIAVTRFINDSTTRVVTWSDNRLVGWHSKPRPNWTKK